MKKNIIFMFFILPIVFMINSTVFAEDTPVGNINVGSMVTFSVSFDDIHEITGITDSNTTENVDTSSGGNQSQELTDEQKARNAALTIKTSLSQNTDGTSFKTNNIKFDGKDNVKFTIVQPIDVSVNDLQDYIDNADKGYKGYNKDVNNGDIKKGNWLFSNNVHYNLYKYNNSGMSVNPTDNDKNDATNILNHLFSDFWKDIMNNLENKNIKDINKIKDTLYLGKRDNEFLKWLKKNYPDLYNKLHTYDSDAINNGVKDTDTFEDRHMIVNKYIEYIQTNSSLEDSVSTYRLIEYTISKEELNKIATTQSSGMYSWEIYKSTNNTSFMGTDGELIYGPVVTSVPYLSVAFAKEGLYDIYAYNRVMCTYTDDITYTKNEYWIIGDTGQVIYDSSREEVKKLNPTETVVINSKNDVKHFQQNVTDITDSWVFGSPTKNDLYDNYKTERIE